VDAGLLVNHLQAIARRENIEVDTEALVLIARAAEGSVRDSLSLLDQAIAHAAGPVGVEHVRAMLGLADRARVIELFEALMRGDIAGALAQLRVQYDTGADPMMVLTDLAEFTHFITRMKIVPSIANDPALIEVERLRGRALAERLSMRVLSRTWQMLLKGIEEVGNAGRPLAAAEMVLVRIAYAADLPTPDEMIRALDEKSERQSVPAPAGTLARGGTSATQITPWPSADATRASSRSSNSAVQVAVSEPQPEAQVISGLENLIALAVQKRDLGVKLALEREIRLVRCEDGRLEIGLEPNAPKTLVNELARKFSQWTGRTWSVVVSAQPAQPTIKAQNDARKAELKSAVRADPLVQAVLARFPGAEIVDVRKAAAVAAGDISPVAEPQPDFAEAALDEPDFDVSAREPVSDEGDD
jgi:DNA polymerase-3 subunit gamma/tau